MIDTPHHTEESESALLAQADYYDEQSKRYAYRPEDAKNKAVSDLTAECYKNASKLKLTREEIEALKADFPDDCFQPGAAGKENLIYIEHAALRERLDNVIGMGQWVMIPVKRWAEDYRYEKEIWENNRRTGQFKEVKGVTIYVEAILVIRECFVGAAIGSMDYYPENHTTDYGDAVEGAETAALRRCCKRLGVGLQAWRKDWCLGWWQRRKQPRQSAPQTHANPLRSHEVPKDTSKAQDDNLKRWAKIRLEKLNKLEAAPGQRNYGLFKDFLLYKTWIKEGQDVIDWHPSFIPVDKEGKGMDALLNELQEFAAQQELAHEQEADNLNL